MLILQYIVYLYFYVGHHVLENNKILYQNNQINVNQNVKFHGTLNNLVNNLDLNCITLPYKDHFTEFKYYVNVIYYFLYFV